MSINTFENFTEKAWDIFNIAIKDYHKHDNVDSEMESPYQSGTIEHSLYTKNWIDTVQWHLEDIIRDPEINPSEALAIKRRIDKSNQFRTDKVEEIDSWFLGESYGIEIQEEAKINTESPAWAIDRLSILALKIYHMREEVERTDITKSQAEKVSYKLSVLEEQKKDLSTAVQELLDDISLGKKYMKTYKQMKMYNDPLLNPILYGKNSNNKTEN
jgi:hypothetical protein